MRPMHFSPNRPDRLKSPCVSYRRLKRTSGDSPRLVHAHGNSIPLFREAQSPSHFAAPLSQPFRHSFLDALRTFHRAKMLSRNKLGILSRIVHMRENLSFSFGKCKTLSHFERHFNRSFRHSFPAALRTFHRSGLCGLSCVAFAFAFIVAPHTLLQLSWPCRPPCARHRAAFYLLFFQYSSILLASKMAFDRIFVFRRVLFHHAK